MEKVKSYITLMRPHHYIKNVLIFLPLIFSRGITNINLLIVTVIGTIAFSLMCSAVYIINDIIDVEKDRKHEINKNRPIAAGKVSIKSAIVLAITLLIITVIFNVYLVSKKILKLYWLEYIVFYGTWKKEK